MASNNPFAEIGANLPSAAGPSASAPAAFSEIGAAPGAPTAGAQQNPVQVAQNTNNKYLGMIGRSDNQGAINQATNVASHNGGGGWLHTVLNAVDLPRAAVVSAIDAVIHPQGSKAGFLTTSSPGLHNLTNAVNQIAQGTQNHMTFGHVLNDAGVQNHLVDSIGGMVGDVAFDPLTYLGGVGKVAGIVGHVAEATTALRKADEAAQAVQDVTKGVQAGTHTVEDLQAATEAHRAAQADAVTKAGVGATGRPILTPQTFSRLQARGIAGLTNTEKAFLSEKTGQKVTSAVGLRVPGTKLLGNPKMVPLVPQAVTDPIAGAAHAAVQKLADTKFANSLSEKIIPSGWLQNMARSHGLAGNGLAGADLTNLERLTPEAAGVARDTLNEYGNKFTQAFKSLPKESLGHVAAAMEGDPVASDAIEKLGGDIAPLQKAYAELRQKAADYGVKIGKIEDYFPHQLTDAAREAFAKNGTRMAARRGFEGAMQRQYKAGDTFLGQTLQDGSVAEMNQIAHDVYGKDAFDLFRSDPREVSAQYVRGLSRAIGQQHLANRLDELGVTARGEQAMTPEEWQALMPSAPSAEATKIVQDELAKRAQNFGNRTADLTSIIGGHHLNGQANLLTPEERAAHDAAAAHQATPPPTTQAHIPADWVKLGSDGAAAGRYGPQYVKDALDKMAEMQSAHQSHGLLGFYDKALNVWKQYALSMPGKAMRHTMAGPAWYAYLAGVGTRSLREGFSTWRSYQKALKANGGDVSAALDRLPGAMGKEVRAALDQGVFHGHEFHSEDLTGPRTLTAKINKATHNPLSTKQGYFRANQDMQRAAQDYWRFAMFHDSMKKGMLAPDAASKVRTFMGDPHNITNFERATARRVIPFYTFLRQNMPVELKALATQPGKFVNAVGSPSNEIGQWSPQGNTPIPQLFQRTGGIPLPLKVGGSTVFLSPDLPFSRFSELTTPNSVAADLAPEFQAGIEALTKTNPYYGNPDSPYGKAMSKAELPGVLGPILHAIDPNGVYKTAQAATNFGVTTPAGQWQMTPEVADILGNINPLMAQGNSLPGVGAQSKKGSALTSLLDQFIGGAVLRTNTPQQQSGELYRRQAILKSIIENLQNRGELPRYIPGFHP